MSHASFSQCDSNLNHSSNMLQIYNPISFITHIEQGMHSNTLKTFEEHPLEQYKLQEKTRILIKIGKKNYCTCRIKVLNQHSYVIHFLIAMIHNVDDSLPPFTTIIHNGIQQPLSSQQ